MTARKRDVGMEPEPARLDLGHLALFVGYATNEAVIREMKKRTRTPVRTSWGFVFQHLLGGARSVRELAALLEITPQGASKTVAEIARHGLVDVSPSPHDARVRLVTLTREGHDHIALARRTRARVAARLERRLGKKAVDGARATLARALDELGGADVVRRRRVVPR
jgi:DNA-binding MarR family transcriptional regulator